MVYLVRLGSVPSLAHPLDVFVVCQVLQSFSYLNSTLYFVLDWPELVLSALSSYIPHKPSQAFVDIIGSQTVAFSVKYYKGQSLYHHPRHLTLLKLGA